MTPFRGARRRQVAAWEPVGKNNMSRDALRKAANATRLACTGYDLETFVADGVAGAGAAAGVICAVNTPRNIWP